MSSLPLDLPDLGDGTRVSGRINNDLAGQLVRELARRWRGGERLQVEEFLQRYPELLRERDAVVRLIYEEFCQRREHGAEQPIDEFRRRFPEHGAALSLLLKDPALGVVEAPPGLPEVGDELGEFRLLSELGRGAVGRVFLAVQPALADRPMVLKVTPADGEEHLCLARLQHTNIVPLYWVHDEPVRNLRVLCMPYFGGTTLYAVIEALKVTLPERRTGKQMIEVIDRAQAGSPVPAPPGGAMRAALAKLSYTQAVCSIVAGLADGLQYAQERNLVHLDVKPSNVLLAGDGQPMLLDFHLARPPIAVNDPLPDWLGGTPEYQSPEQEAALQSLRLDLPLQTALDGRSDIYSLGMVLYEALGGTMPPAGDMAEQLRRCNPAVSPGLADIVRRCLRPRPVERYQGAAELANDLRRHILDRPLRGVAERSISERWRKWRRREPHALPLTLLRTMVLALLLSLMGAGTGYYYQRSHEAELALAESHDLLKRGEHEEAARTAERGLQCLRWLPGRDDLREALRVQADRIQQARAAHDLHALADRLRFLVDPEALSPETAIAMEAYCRSIWELRDRLLAHVDGDGEARQRLHADLLDVALLWSDLRLRSLLLEETAEARGEILRVLDEAERRLGPSPVLSRARAANLEARGDLALADEARQLAALSPPQSAWEHYLAGRWLLRAGDLAEAGVVLERAVTLQPSGFWPAFTQGVCAYRQGRSRDAVEAFRVCIAMAPGQAVCYYNRGLAYHALGQREQARRDYDRALEIQPGAASVALNRGVLNYQESKHEAALADLRRALAGGAAPARVHLNLALVHRARNDRKSARASAEEALRQGNAEARQLLESLRKP